MGLPRDCSASNMFAQTSSDDFYMQTDGLDVLQATGLSQHHPDDIGGKVSLRLRHFAQVLISRNELFLLFTR